MPQRVPPADDDVHDLELLIRAHHPLIMLETEEPERGATLVKWVADRLRLVFLQWSPDVGLSRPDVPSFAVEGSKDPAKCLDHIRDTRSENLYYLAGFANLLKDDDALTHKLRELSMILFDHRGALVLPTAQVDLPTDLVRVATTVRLSSPTAAQYYAFVRQLLRDLKLRMPVEVKMSGAEVGQLLNHLQGLTLFEVKKVLTKAIVEDGGLGASDIPRIAEAKKQIVERSGVLEYFSAEETMSEVAGLTRLKQWLDKRKAAFAEPERAKQFGLSPPRGVMLLGVQGCGKSMCAKAIASEWSLPLIRLDPSNLYNKFVGESEKNLKRATTLAEQMAPVVLWIDEIEKAFGSAGDNDSGTSSRIFGSFLAWMQEKKPGVFVVATSNDITRLPPELLRKGRFDEIFFVDLPAPDVRRQIVAVHLARRHRDPAEFDLDTVAAHTEGFSGAELEQMVVSSLYSAFSGERPLDTALLLEEAARTVPLSVTAHEKIHDLRTWAQNRTVPAE